MCSLACSYMKHGLVQDHLKCIGGHLGHGRAFSLEVNNHAGHLNCSAIKLMLTEFLIMHDLVAYLH